MNRDEIIRFAVFRAIDEQSNREADLGEWLRSKRDPLQAATVEALEDLRGSIAAAPGYGLDEKAQGDFAAKQRNALAILEMLKRAVSKGEQTGDLKMFAVRAVRELKDSLDRAQTNPDWTSEYNQAIDAGMTALAAA